MQSKDQDTPVGAEVNDSMPEDDRPGMEMMSLGPGKYKKK